MQHLFSGEKVNTKTWKAEKLHTSKNVSKKRSERLEKAKTIHLHATLDVVEMNQSYEARRLEEALTGGNFAEQ